MKKVTRAAILALVVSASIVIHGGAMAVTSAGRIAIGQSIALTGPLGPYGQAKRDGALLYFEALNRRGGIHGRSVELITRDDAYDPALAVANTRALVKSHQVVALLGHFGVQTIDAVLPLMEELRVPLVGLTSGSRSLRTPAKTHVFPVRASFFDEARQLTSHAELLGLNRIAVVYQENGFGHMVRDEFALAAREQGITDLQMVSVANDGANATQAVQTLRSDRQAIMLAMASGPAIPLLSAMASAKLGMPVYGTAGVDATRVTAKLGVAAKGLGQTQVVPRPTGRTRRVVAEYQDALNSLRPGTPPSYFGLEGFIEAKVLAEGLRRIDGVPTPAALVRTLESFGRWDMGDFAVTYGPGVRQGSSFIELTVVSSTGKVIE